MLRISAGKGKRAGMGKKIPAASVQKGRLIVAICNDFRRPEYVSFPKDLTTTPPYYAIKTPALGLECHCRPHKSLHFGHTADRKLGTSPKEIFKCLKSISFQEQKQAPVTNTLQS